MTVILISSPRVSSIAVPQIISASSPTSWWILSEASVISFIVRSLVQVMFIRTPLAPVMETSSRSGWEIAFSAASIALFSPLATPIPINAIPAFDMVVLTSAKSRLISPGTIIKSVIPFTEWCRISSAFLNMEIMVASFGAIPRNLSFGMVITVSATLFSSIIPCSACLNRFFPSKEKGFETTATVSAPCSLQISAMTGAAPVPVPPPKPAVMNTIWLSANASLSSFSFSIAACFPTSGLAPAPRPSVRIEPIWILTDALDVSSDWASVFAAINWTPARSASIMLLIAFPPAPPTPMTLILAVLSFCKIEKLINPTSW